MDKRTELLNKIKAGGFLNNEIVLTLDEFFDGNDDSSSIGVNIYPDQPSPQTFYEVFKTLIQSGKIESAFVRVADIEDVDWFFSDTIFVLGQIDVEDLKKEVAVIKPTEIYLGWMYGLPANIQDDFSDKQVCSLWWD